MSDLHNKNNEERHDLQVWYCQGCQCIHFKAQNIMLNFTKKEFVELNNAMHEILLNDFNVIELDKYSSVVNVSEDILSSELIS